MDNNFVISGVKMFKPSSKVESANIHVSGDKIFKITRGCEVIHDKNLQFFAGVFGRLLFYCHAGKFFQVQKKFREEGLLLEKSFDKF